MSKMTAEEYASAIQRAYNECSQETLAATLAYQEQIQPIAEIRKKRGREARDKRDKKIAAIKEQFNRENK
jgi:hypothetical protein